MTTTPTFWSQVITFDQNQLQSFSTAKVTALSDNSFAIVWEDGTDLFGRHFDEQGQLTSGNFLGALSQAQAKEISNPLIFEQVDGRVVVEFELLFGAGDGDKSGTARPSITRPAINSISRTPKDKLIGGLNDDTFDFNAVGESKRDAADVIKDYRTGPDLDLIDLEGIDAKKGGADNKFKFIGTQDFHHRAASFTLRR